MSKPKRSLPVMVAACSLCLAGAIATAAEDAPKQNKGLKQTELCAVELGSDAEQIVNRSVRERLITLEPGGHIRQHGHAYRPTIFHILEGELTSYRGEQPGYVLRAGECDVLGREVTPPLAAEYRHRTGQISGDRRRAERLPWVRPYEIGDSASGYSGGLCADSPHRHGRA